MKYVVLDDFASGSVRLQAGAILDDAEHAIPLLVSQGASVGPIPTAIETEVMAAIAAYLNQRGVGERELVPYGSMLSNILSSNAGASFVKTESGLSVEQVLSVGGGVPYAYILRPNDPAPGPGVYTNWADLYADYSTAVSRPSVIFFDDALGTITIPAGNYTIDTSLTLRGVLLSQPATINFADGAIFNTIPFCNGVLLRSLSSQPVCTNAVPFGLLASFTQNAFVKADGTAAFFRIQDGSIITCQGSGGFVAGASPVVEIDGSLAFAALVLPLGQNAKVEPNTIATAGVAENGTLLPILLDNGSWEISWDQPAYDSIAGPINAQMQQGTIARIGIVRFNTSGTLNAQQYGFLILVDTSAGNVTVTLQTLIATFPAGTEFMMKKTTPDANIARLEGLAPDTVEGAAGFDLTAHNQAVHFVSDGINNLAAVGAYP